MTEGKKDDNVVDADFEEVKEDSRRRQRKKRLSPSTTIHLKVTYG